MATTPGAAFGLTPQPAPHHPTTQPQRDAGITIPPSKPAQLPKVRAAVRNDVRTDIDNISALLRERWGSIHAASDSAARTVWYLNQLTPVSEALDNATLFHVAEPMTKVAVDAARDVPLDATLEHREPAKTGLIMYAGGLPEFRGVDGQDTPTRPELVLWDIHGDHAHIGVFSRRSAHPDFAKEVALITGSNGDWITVAMFSASTTTPICDIEVDDESVTIIERSIIGLLLATWELMRTPTVADVTTKTEPGPRIKGSKRRQPDSDVNVITLRPMLREKTPDATTSVKQRTYTHQWVVRGHWRNQAHGKDRAERRLTWIPSYLKGPEGAPLKNTETVFAWRH